MTHLLRRLGLAAIVYTSLNFSAEAQITTVYSEDFDSPPHNVTTFHTQSGPSPFWNDTTALKVSGTHSYHANVLPQDTVYFQTLAFSTVGNSFVRLSFDHIGKIHFGQRGYISVSTNNGATWTTLTGSHYRGASTSFATLGYVNEVMYANSAASPFWGGATTLGQGIAPTNGWWANEVFDISSIAGSGPSGTGTGFSQVMVRFALQYRVPSGTAVAAGWFVDNVKVEAAPCELIPPLIKWNLNPRKEPIGARYQASEEIRLRATDKVLPKSGMDSVVLHYRMNNGPWNWLNMTAINPANCPDSSEYTHTFSNLVVGDTVDWYVIAYDCACDENTVRSPSTAAAVSFNTFWRDPSPPAVCGPSLPNSWPFVATQFPYVENFEAFYWMAGTGAGSSGTSHRGVFPLGNPPAGRNYEVSPSPLTAGFGWSVRTGPTATFGTGPAGDHTTGSGKYLYTEASQGTSGNTTLFITPCLKLENLSNVAAEFYYHKFGAHMGNLRVDIDTGTGFTTGNGVIGAALITGQTQRSNLDPWKKGFLNLNAYKGKYVRLRFVGTKTNTATNDRGDMALDDIKIFQPFVRDLNLLESFSPRNGFCTYTNQENVRIRVRTEGSQSLTKIPLAFSVKNLTTGVTVISRDTINGTFNMGDTLSYNFVPKANLSAFADFEVFIWGELANDGQHNNDSIGPITIEHIQPITTFPYFLNFDGPGWTPGNGTTANPGTFAPSGWFASPASNSSEYAFMLGKDLTPTPSTGPRWSTGRKGNYIYAEGNFGANSPFALFQQDGCIDLTGKTTPVISFWYHMYGSDIASLGVQVVPSGSNTWTTLTPSVITGQQQTANTDDWKFQMVDLSAYAGQTIKLRFVAGKNAAGSFADIAIDDILIYDRPNNDVGVTAITSPPNTVFLNAPQNLIIKVRNYGKQAKTNVPVTVQVSDLCTPASVTNYTYTVPSIAVDAEATLTVTTPVTYWEGDLQIKAWTTLAADGFSRNDTAVRITNGNTNVNIPFGPVTFENCVGNEYAFYPVGGTGTLQMWEMGTVGQGWSAASGSRAWMTGLNQNYKGVSTEYLRFPPLTNFDTIMGAELRFKHQFDFAPGDGGNVEYLQNGIWRTLGNATANIGTNWYGSSYGSAGIVNLGNQPGWAGNSSNQWITSTIPLSMWNFNANPLNLRLRMGAGASNSARGWAVDDVQIYVPPQNSMAPITIDTKEYLIVPDQNSTLKVFLENTGAKPVSSILVRYKVNNGSWTTYDTLTFSPALPRGGRRWHEFSQPWLNNGVGTYSICVETSSPNGKQDNLVADDQLCQSFPVSDKIYIDATGYCNDFEDPSKAAWLPLHSSIKTAAHDWEFGTPAQTVISSAASGTKAWMTKLTSNYTAMGRSSLHTPFFVLDSNVVYSLKFDHNMFSEHYHDGGSLDWSYNGGINWYTLGNVLPSGKWYNTVHVTSLDNIRPGWSGSTNGWANSIINFTADNTGTLVFRFRFGADYTLSNEGWAVDNFCLQRAPLGTPADILNIGLPEASLGDAFLSGVSPSPSQGATAGVDFQSNEGGTLRLTVFTLLGQPVLSQSFEHTGGLIRLEWETAQLPSGLYHAVIEWNGQSYTRRFVR
ncbi:MAG: hypothetical protein RL276_1254 [Bacteroidota bacterium]